MQPDGNELVRVAREVLDVDVDVAVTRTPLDPRDLTRLQMMDYVTLPLHRQHDYLLGRRALGLLLRYRRETAVVFPHPLFSLTHACEVAVAAQLNSLGYTGIGIDFEGQRAPHRDSARFYLSDAELGQSGLQRASLLHLWTVKEALFKSTPNNHQYALADYSVDHVEALQGSARMRAFCFDYVSITCDVGYLTLAVSRLSR